MIGSSHSNIGNQFGFYQISFTIDLGENATVAKVISEDFVNDFCFDVATGPDGTLYCLSEDIDSVIGLYLVNFNTNSLDEIASTGIIGGTENKDIGLAISSDGTIYYGNKTGLYTFNPNTEESTKVVFWDNNDNGEVDEPNFEDTPSEEDPFGFFECQVSAMDFDSSETLYAIMFCEDESIFTKIDLEPAVIPGTESGQANLTLYQIFRNEQLDLSGEDILSDPMTFSPFDFDFLLGTTYGLILNGTDSFSALIENGDNVIMTDVEPAGVTLCDNTELSLDGETEILANGCDTILITVNLGTVGASFTPNNEDILPLTTRLNEEDSVIFDPAACTLSYASTNSENFIEVKFDEEIIKLLPDDILECFKPIDHYLGYDAKIIRVDDDDDDDDDDSNDRHNDKHSKYKKYLKYFKEHYPEVYKKYSKYLKYFKENNSDKYEKYFKYANYYYEKYHDEDDDEPKPEKLTVNLTDKFISANYEVKKIKKLYNPVDKNGEGIESPEPHLVSYDIKKLKGEPNFEKVKNIQVTNQFGEVTVALKKDAKKLLVPSNKTHDQPATELDDIVINHFKCYDAKVYKYTPKWDRKQTVNLQDQFAEEPITMKLKKPEMLCSPVDKNSEGIENEENFLLCYDLKKIKGEPKFKKLNVFTNNQFGPEELEVKKPKHLCVPSEVTLPK